MSVSNRSALITTTHAVLKKHYVPSKPPADRTVLEHLLYACCLENASYEAADEAFARLQQNHFDWNEVRVTTTAELAESMVGVPDAPEAALRLKRCLQAIFETHYAFDLEHLRKLNLGVAVKELEGIRGITPFVVSYVSQNALGGHSIPVSQGVLSAMKIVGVITEAEAKKNKVPGLERAIPKAKGVEVGSLLHRLGADLYASPYSSRVKSILVEIAPDAKQRLPKRPTKETAHEERDQPRSAKSGTAGKKKAASKKKLAGKKAVTKKVPGKKKTTKKKDVEKKLPRAKKSTAKKKSATKQLSRKKPK